MEAIAQVERFKPDLILMDIIMPDMDGLETTRQIRQLSAQQQMPIVAISASISLESRQESFTAGCDDFLIKPVQLTAVLDKLGHYLPLEWVYDDDIEKQPPAAQSIIPPSQTDLDELLSLSIMGDISSMKNCLADLGKDDQYTVFITDLNRLIVDFKMREIGDYIRSYLER
jgi:response regulator of citrate/malate metabolism